MEYLKLLQFNSRHVSWPMGLTLGITVIVFVTYRFFPEGTTAVLSSALRQSVPLILGALCGLWCERSGVMNIGIEGQMLFSAFTGFSIHVWTGNLLWAVWGALFIGGLLGFFLAMMTVSFRMDQIIAGIVINTLAFGVTGYLYQADLSSAGKLQPVPLGVLQDIPLLGTVLFSHPPLTYLAFLLIPSCHYVLFKTRWGLRTRAVGEHPQAADTLGINVFFIRYANVIAGGVFAGLGGAFLTLEAVGTFERGMTSGRGFVALAIMIFGKWSPFGILGGALLLGLTMSLQTQMQFMEWFQIPHQFMGLLPYLLTIIVLAGFVGRTQPPAAIGRPYTKE